MSISYSEAYEALGSAMSSLNQAIASRDEKHAVQVHPSQQSLGSFDTSEHISTTTTAKIPKIASLASSSRVGKLCRKLLKPNSQSGVGNHLINKPHRVRDEEVFRFLDLPPEVRIRFYELLLVKKTDERNPDGVIDVCGDEFWDRPPAGDYHLWTHPILRSNGQIRGEGLHEFFTKNIFSFGNEFNMNLFLNVIGNFGRHRIRSIRIHGLPYLWMGEESYDVYAWCRFENFIRMITRLENLRHLRVQRNPFYFQERTLDDEDEDEPLWYPALETLDLNRILKGAYIGPLTQLRGLKSLEIDWPFLDQFEPRQKAWFNEIQRQVALFASQDKPETYHSRGKFIITGYEREFSISAGQYAKFYFKKSCPSRVRLALRKPSNFFSTFAHSPEQYEREQKWAQRRHAINDFLWDCWDTIKIPKRKIRSLLRRSRRARSPTLVSLTSPPPDNLFLPPLPPGILYVLPSTNETAAVVPDWLQEIDLNVFQ